MILDDLTTDDALDEDEDDRVAIYHPSGDLWVAVVSATTGLIDSEPPMALRATMPRGTLVQWALVQYERGKGKGAQYRREFVEVLPPSRESKRVAQERMRSRGLGQVWS